jgi:predicted transcriptional regulator
MRGVRGLERFLEQFSNCRRVSAFSGNTVHLRRMGTNAQTPRLREEREEREILKFGVVKNQCVFALLLFYSLFISAIRRLGVQLNLLLERFSVW